MTAPDQDNTAAKELRAQWKAEVEVHQFSEKDVAKHNTKQDCWIIVHGKVYDVTRYTPDHPGGVDYLYEVAGQDATGAFEDVGHSEDAREILHPLLVGVLKGATLDAHAAGEAVKVVRKDPELGQHEAHKHVSLMHNTAFVAGALGVLGLAVTIPITLKRSDLHLETGFAKLGLALSGSHGFLKGFFLATLVFSVVAIGIAQRMAKSLNVVKAGFSRYPAHMKAETASPRHQPTGFLKPRDYQTLPLVKKEELSHDSARLTFALPKSKQILGLPTGQHVAIRAHLADDTIVTRSYTPTSNNSDVGKLELVIKNYTDGLLTGKYLSKLQLGDEVEFRGPKGAMRYRRGYAKQIGMIAGGTGITPLFQIIRAVCEDDFDQTNLSLIYANKSEDDILLRRELDRFAAAYSNNVKVHYVINKAKKSSWTGSTGHVTKDLITKRLPAPGPDTKFLLCGPPGMMTAMKQHLVELGCQKAGSVSKMSDDVFIF